jgi:hypothetical protein
MGLAYACNYHHKNIKSQHKKLKFTHVAKECEFELHSKTTTILNTLL